MLNRLDAIVLGLLTAHPRTGYDVRKWLDQYGRAVGYSAQTSQIYRQLARLADHGLAEVVHDARTTGPDAKLYVLTDEGARLFDEWLSSPFEPSARPLDPDFQVRLHFSYLVGPEAVLELVRTELAFRRVQNERALPIDHTLLPDDATGTEREWFEDLSLLGQQRGRTLVANLIAWLEAAEAHLEFLVRTGRYGSVRDARARSAARPATPTTGSRPA